jgi:hypothetical protein
MCKTLLSFAALALAAAGASAQDSTIWSCVVPNVPNGGWVVGFPTGSSDYFSVAYSAVATLNVEGGTVSKTLPIKSVGVSVTDFNSGHNYPTVGVFRPNVGLDPLGNTPDLGLPVATAATTPLPPGVPLFQYVPYDTSAQVLIPPADATTLAVVQLPPGDSGLLGVGADGNPSTLLTSGYSADGYATPAVTLSFLDFGISIGQDNSVTNSCKPADRIPHGRLRAQKLQSVGIENGDHLTTTVAGGDTLNLTFFGSKSGDKWRIYFAGAPCSPAVAIGPVLPTTNDSDGDGSFLRINATFPMGFANSTFRFAAVWGNGSCLSPGAGFTNCVTVITGPDPVYGIVDDCTIESGWVVGFPTGSSDYFNNSFGPKPSNVNGVTGVTAAVLDFGIATPEYPSVGVSTANTGVDPSGNTPDLGAGILGNVTPFTFPSLTFSTTCSQYISHPVSVPGSAMTGPSIHGWVQLPPGDSGLLGVGADSSSPSAGKSFYTSDGYTTPAISFFANWGIRIKTN